MSSKMVVEGSSLESIISLASGSWVDSQGQA